MNWLAIDIGGANLKVADGANFAAAYAFPLYRKPLALTQQLRTLLAESPRCDHLAFTMTGELADCFGTKDEGVRFILTCILEAAAGRHTRVYLNDGRLVTPQVALQDPPAAAAANWHALARYAARFIGNQPGLLIDVGSTTADIVPLLDGAVAARGRNDTDRLLAGELLYTGVERSPLCGVVREVPYRGGVCPVAQELFATIRDVWLVLEELPEQSESKETADQRPATKAAARARLGRMICADPDQFNHHDAVTLAEAAAAAQTEMLIRAMRRAIALLPVAPQVAVLSGHGEFLAARAIQESGLSLRTFSLGKLLGPELTRSATAHALAVLAREATQP